MIDLRFTCETITSGLSGRKQKTRRMGFAMWINRQGTLAWAQGTHEYRPMGTAVISGTDQFRHRDFQQTRRRPADLEKCFVGFFGSLEEVNVTLRKPPAWNRRPTPAHLR